MYCFIAITPRSNLKFNDSIVKFSDMGKRDLFENNSDLIEPGRLGL